MGAPQVKIGGRLYPATLSTDEAADWLQCGADKLRLTRGHGIVTPLELGNRLRWPTLAVAQALGLDAEVVPGDLNGDAGTLPDGEPALVGAAVPSSSPGDDGT